jgi:hypothetical protein
MPRHKISMILAQNETICKLYGIKTEIQGAKIVMGSAAQNLETRCAASFLPLSWACDDGHGDRTHLRRLMRPLHSPDC